MSEEYCCARYSVCGVHAMYCQLKGKGNTKCCDSNTSGFHVKENCKMLNHKCDWTFCPGWDQDHSKSGKPPEYPEVLKHLDLRVGDKVTVRDKDGNEVRGTVSRTEYPLGVAIKLLRTAELYVTDKNIATNGYDFTDIVRKPEPKPWDEAPNGTIAYVGSCDSRDIARKSTVGVWYWLANGLHGPKPKQNHFEDCYVELVPKED